MRGNSPDGGYLETAVSNMITNMLRHCDLDERQTDGSRHWDTVRPKLVKTFAQEARDFDDGYWLMVIDEGSNKMRIEYCKDNNGSLCCLRAIHGHSGGIPTSRELHACSIQMEGVHLSQRNFVEFSIHFWGWSNSGRKRE